MKFSKKFFSIFLVICMLFVCTFQVAAAENTDINNMANKIAEEIDVTSIIGEVDGEISEFAIDLGDQETDASSRGIHVPNRVIGTLTPGELGFAITVTNIGLDKISYIYINVDIYKNNGTYVTSFQVTDTNVPVGTTTYTHLLDKSATVQETIVITGYAQDGATYDFGKTTTYRYNFVGGAYGTMAAYDGQRHHIPSDSVTSITTYSGPAIRMVTADHRLTASYGSSASAISFRAQEAALIAEGKFDEAMQLGIDDIRSLFGTKYDKAIAQMISYAVASGYITAGSVE